MVIYRPGAVTAEEIRETAGPVELYRGEECCARRLRRRCRRQALGCGTMRRRRGWCLIEAADEEWGDSLKEAAGPEAESGWE